MQTGWWIKQSSDCVVFFDVDCLIFVGMELRWRQVWFTYPPLPDMFKIHIIYTDFYIGNNIRKLWHFLLKHENKKSLIFCDGYDVWYVCILAMVPERLEEDNERENRDRKNMQYLASILVQFILQLHPASRSLRARELSWNNQVLCTASAKELRRRFTDCNAYSSW